MGTPASASGVAAKGAGDAKLPVELKGSDQ